MLQAQKVIPSWKEIGRLAERIGLPDDKFRSAESDSVLDKSAGIELFQNLFIELASRAEELSSLAKPAAALSELLFKSFREIFPRLPFDTQIIPDALTTIEYIALSSNSKKTNFLQNLERKSLSIICSAIEDLSTNCMRRCLKIQQLAHDGFNCEGAQVVLLHSLRMATLKGGIETLIYRGEISRQGFNLIPFLTSDFEKEPYQTAYALHRLSQMHLLSGEFGFIYPESNRLSSGYVEASERLNVRYRLLKPQVHALVDESLVYALREALKFELIDSRDVEIAKRFERADFDPVRFLKAEAARQTEEASSALVRRIDKRALERLGGDLFTFALQGWEVPVTSKSGQDLSFHEVLATIRSEK